MRKNIIIGLVSLIINTISAQHKIAYDFASIPDSLLKHAHAVIRHESNKYTYESANKIIQEHHVVVTIIDEQGKNEAIKYYPYDQNSKIDEIEGKLFDKNGTKIRSLKNKEIKDYGMYDDFSLATDDRFKRIDFEYSIYPYTVEFEVKYVINNTHRMLSDQINNTTDISVEYFESIFEIPKDTLIHFFIYNLNEEAHKKDIIDGSKRRIKYYLSGLKCKKYEPMANFNAPYIIGKFENFQYDKYKGSFKSWKDYGNFILTLNTGRDELPEEEKKSIDNVIATCQSTEEKISKLYKYMQSKTRYVSIQYGIGGHQPFPAKDVSKNGYGDCKALSNYMYSILKYAGIKSNYVLIYAGHDQPNISFDKHVIPWFNHAILVVPMADDSIWLECTNQTSALNYQGNFTGNRKALVIEKDKSEIVNTNRYVAQDNNTLRNAVVDIDENGSCTANVQTVYKCMNAEFMIGIIDRSTNEETQKFMSKRYDLTYRIDSMQLTKDMNAKQSATEKLQLTLPYYASKNGKRIFIVPNLFSKVSSLLTKDSLRQNMLYIDDDFSITDSITIHIPSGYKIESCPKETHINKPYGEYHIYYNKSDKSITYIRKKIQHRGYYDKSLYNDFVQYNAHMYQHDRNKIVLTTL